MNQYRITKDVSDVLEPILNNPNPLSDAEVLNLYYTVIESDYPQLSTRFVELLNDRLNQQQRLKLFKTIKTSSFKKELTPAFTQACPQVTLLGRLNESLSTIHPFGEATIADK
jgi:hypothetical protein